MENWSLLREVKELKNQLSYSKNIGFFFGAGTSCSIGIPNIAMLTTEVESAIDAKLKSAFGNIKTDLKTEITDRDVNIEDILNLVRKIREITNEKKDKTYLGVTGVDAKELDKSICDNIYEIIEKTESVADLKNANRFFAWYNNINQEFAKEVFTTNYDLVIERALESCLIPYFDGFVGSFEPFFWQESIDAQIKHDDITRNWIRLWKIHGSLSWFWKRDSANKTLKINRLGKLDGLGAKENELVIYPSKEKYEASRKQPFVAYFDRLRDYLTTGELLFVFAGYSFSDEHINEIIFNALRQNNRLFVMIFFYSDKELEKFHKLYSSYMNLNAFSPKLGIINGNLYAWDFDKTKLPDTEVCDHYWDDSKKEFTLGDFKQLVEFLIRCSGRSEKLAVP